MKNSGAGARRGTWTLSLLLVVFAQGCLGENDTKEPDQPQAVSDGYVALMRHCRASCDGWCQMRCASGGGSSDTCVAACAPHECLPTTSAGDREACEDCCGMRGLPNPAPFGSDGASDAWTCESVCALATQDGPDASLP